MSALVVCLSLVLLRRAAASDDAEAAPFSSALLERLVAPMGVSRFYEEVYEQHWAHFPHDEQVVPVEMRPTLADVTMWASRVKSFQVDEQLEILPHPESGKVFKKRKESALDSLHRAFSAGHSMVINSLQDYSEVSRRLVGALIEALGWPVDAYMYLTPPFSSSYGVHSDVMDAWMLQIEGSKEWSICEPRNYIMTASSVNDKTLNCTSVTMRRGDAMYVPFGTLHRASTVAELSSHLTVNVERQCYTWANLLQAAAVHAQVLSGSLASQPSLSPWDYLGSGGFTMEAESPLERWLLMQMRQVPALGRTPLAGLPQKRWSQVLARSASFEDMPLGYWPAFVSEWQTVIAALEAKVSSGPWPAVAWGGREEELRPSTITEASLRWAAEVARVHSVQHLHGDVWLAFSAIGSLAELRSKAVSNASQELRFIRPPAARVVVAEHLGRHKLWVNTNVQARSLDPRSAAAVTFACGLFAPQAARGRSFVASEVPWQGDTAERDELLLQLVHLGALTLAPVAAAGDLAQ